MQAEPFAYRTFDVVAAIGAFGGLFADDETDSCVAKIIGTDVDLEEGIAAHLAQTKNG